MWIDRHSWLNKIQAEFDIHPICVLLGPRQCGKTSLARDFSRNQTHHFFDCENPLHLALLDSPLFALQDLKGLIIIDEIQLRPDLFSILRVLVDQDAEKKFLITGSASRDLIEQSSQTLAGRVGMHEIGPFDLSEVDDFSKLWQRGGFPKSFLAASTALSIRWRDQYIQTFLERDLAWMGFDFNPSLMKKFWAILAHYHAQILTISELSTALQRDQRTLRRYLEILEGTFMIRLLKPYASNTLKRETKTPKLYFRDSGLLHRLCGVAKDNILMHPKVGLSLEGVMIEEIIRALGADLPCYFWRTHAGAELDLLIEYEGKRLGFEIKMSDRPTVTRSMRQSMVDLELDHLFVVIPHKLPSLGSLEEKISLMGIDHIAQLKALI